MKDIRNWWPLIAAILAAGMWLGRLDTKVAQLEAQQQYLHGAVDVPKGTQ